MRVTRIPSDFQRCDQCDKLAHFCIPTKFAGKIHLCTKCLGGLGEQITKILSKGTDENLPRKASW
jgi:hypothetical protein